MGEPHKTFLTAMADDDENAGPKYVYEGDKKDGDATLQHGKGKAIYKNGDVYEGDYEEGKRHGSGVYKWAKHVTDEESGELKLDVDEEGNTVFSSTYTGQYVANLKEGEGVFEYPDGGKYQGNWRHDKRHGDGVYWYPNGDIYSGEGRFGTKHGRGTFIHSDSNARLVGTFTDGKFVKGKWVMADSTYTGGYKDNKPFGPGQFVFKSGNRQDGVYEQKAPSEEDAEDEAANSMDPQWVGGGVSSVCTETYQT